MKLKGFVSLAAVLAALFVIIGIASASDSPREDKVLLPIVMYHEINYTKLGKDIISPWDFESDLKHLRDEGYTAITMRELIDYYEGGAALPPKPIILSFDDGYLSNYNYVLPLLEKYDAKIVFSIIVKETENFTETPNYKLDFAHVTWPQVSEMLASGRVDIQNHTYNLHRITKSLYGSAQKNGESFSDYEQRLEEDLSKAQNEIFRMTGMTPTTFTYPYGKFNDNTDIILRNMGFKATLSCIYGINVITPENPDGLYQSQTCVPVTQRAARKALGRGL